MKSATGRFVVISLGAVAGAGVLIWALAVYLPIKLIDFNHYLQASAMLWRGQDPYGSVEFFAPPWLALFVGPFLWLPPQVASATWILICLGCICAVPLVATRWLNFPSTPRGRVLVLVCSAFMPAASYVYITGQLSALVGLAMLIIFRGIISRSPSPLGLTAGLALVTFKPHIVAVPLILFGLDLLRRQEWHALGWMAMGMVVLISAGFALLPNWPTALLQAFRNGAYRGGPGLVAPGYVGFQEIGIPGWVFAPLLIYLLGLWWRSGLTVYVVALAFAINLLVIPYSRSYDLVILIFPALAGLALTSHWRRWGVGTLVLIALGLAPVVGLALTAPALITIALLESKPTPIVQGFPMSAPSLS